MNKEAAPTSKKPDFYQRAIWHDYRSRCFYMITFNKAPDAPALSRISGSVSDAGIIAHTDLTPSGSIIREVLQLMPRKFPNIEIRKWVIMPDHVHFILFVREDGKDHLGEIIRILKKESTAKYKSEYPQSPIAIRNGSLFTSGFNDRIVFKERQLARYRNYVADNPRRYYLRLKHPEFFNRCENIQIEGKVFSIYGNFLLLRHPDRECVRISSKFTAEELSARQNSWNETIRGAGVLISPFISKDEKEVMKRGIEHGASIIRIVENGFPERYKPSGAEFNLYAEGRLLIIAPAIFKTKREKIRRDECMAMNRLAEYLAALDSDSMALIGRGFKGR